MDILDNNGYSPLAHACIGQFKEMAEYLLSKGAAVNPKDGVPPLIKVIDNQDIDLFNLLLDHGADLHCRTTKWKDPAFHYACANNYNKIIPLFFSRGIDINEKDSRGVTPLIYAAVNTNSSLISLLLANHADATISLDGGVTPFHIVCEAGDMPSFNAFKENEHFKELANIKDANGLLPIAYAGEKKHEEIISILLPISEGFENETAESVIEKYVEKEPAKEEKPKESPLTEDDKTIIHKKKVEGVGLFNKGKYEEAIKVFETVLLLNPNDEV